MRRVLTISSFLFLSACAASEQPSSLSLRSLSKTEGHADLSELVEKMRALYGPLKYKEARFGFTLDSVAAEHHALIDEAKSDEEIQGVFAKFLTKFDDAHVGISFVANTSGISSYQIPIYIIPVENRALITSVDPSLQAEGIAVGDEVLSVDGQSPFDLLPTILKYRSLANEISGKQFLYRVFNRPFYMTELTPTSGTSDIVLTKADGSKYQRQLTWRTTPSFSPNLNNLVKSHSLADALNTGLSVDIGREMNAAAGLDKMGATLPFFASPEVAKKFGLVRVTANSEFLTKHGLVPDKSPEIYAGLYRFSGKTLLLVRQPGYSHDKATEGFSNEDYMKAYEAIFDQYEGLVDGLVIDQTHNGGGSYCEDFFTLFIQNQKNGFVQKMHADRKWIVDLHDYAKEVDPTLKSEMSRALINSANIVEKAYDAGQDLSEPIALMGGRNLVSPHAAYVWKKPFMVLIDELAGSCADAFPLLVKNNGVAKLFGERTIGAGGNVEEVVQLSNSRATVKMTRGLFTSFHPNGIYPLGDFVENNGVQPDYHYEHSVNDVRAGYVTYFEEFSKKMLDQIK